MSIKFTTVPAKRLAESITGASTTFKVSNILGWDGASLTSADFGTRLWAVFRNSAGTLMEIMEVDPTTITSPSSPVTILTRGLKFTGDRTTSVAANKLTWIKGDTIVEFGTHVPQLFEGTVRTDGDQTIDDIKTFTSLPVSTGGNAISGTQLVTYAQALSLATGTANINQMILAGTAGETIASGNIVYLKSSDNRWWLASSAASATSENVILGIAQGAGTAGSAITNGVLIQGVDSKQTGLTSNTLYYLSTAGGVSTSPGTKAVALGYSGSTTSIFFKPNFNLQISNDQFNALVGNNGTPATGNKFITQSGFQNGAEIYTTELSGGSTAYTATYSPAITALTDGMELSLKVAVTNSTTTPTFSPNGLTARTIVKLGGTALSIGDIVVGMNKLKYDSTNTRWILITPAAAAISISTQAQAIASPAPGAGVSGSASCATTGFSETEPFFTICGSAGSGNTLTRWIKLPNGSVIATHTTNVTASNVSVVGYCCVIGSFVYTVTSSGGTAALTRFSSADLSGQTAMTISGTAIVVNTTIWSDGTNLFNFGSAGNSQKYTISGTTATSSTTLAFTSCSSTDATWCDGTSVYQIAIGSQLCYKWALAGGARTTGTAFVSGTYMTDSGTMWSVGGGIMKANGDTSYIHLLIMNTATGFQAGKLAPVTIF